MVDLREPAGALRLIGTLESPMARFAAGAGFGRRSRSALQGSARKRRSRRLLVTTKTEENAIAAPAIIGLSRPAAASGRAATL